MRDLTEWTRATVRAYDQPPQCHECEASIGGPGSQYFVATTHDGRRVDVCFQCAPRGKRWAGNVTRSRHT